MAQLIVAGPLSKLDLGYQLWLDPVAPLHNCACDSKTPPAGFPLWQVNKRAARALDLLHALVQGRQGSFGKSGPDSAGEQETARTLVADKQGAKVFATAFWRGVASDHKLLLRGQLDLDPGAAASAGLVERVRSFGIKPSN